MTHSFSVLAVLVAQLVERSFLTPKSCRSNPDIGKVLSTNCTKEKREIKKKRQGMAHLFLSLSVLCFLMHALAAIVRDKQERL